MADNGDTPEMLDENGQASAAVAGVEYQEGDARFAELLGTNFLTYAVSVLTDRALPDVRDGLLPVQRRILLAMDDLGLKSNGPTRKCAKVVGETMGNYHPHGDLAIYGALVRMAQDFSLRGPLITPQGNFGNIDGDGAAASRYTECKLSPLAEQLLEHLDPEVLPDDYGRNYDESRVEPHVLPAAYPNLLVNGNIGIAVGMTCQMLPHNFGEVIDLAVWRATNPDATDAALVKRMSGPDFPTGALVVANDSLNQSYLTGQGKVTVRGETHIEPLAGNREAIVITSLPWGVGKGGGKGLGLLEKMAKQYSDGMWPEWSDLNDYSTDDMRIVIELKRGTNARATLAKLYKNTDLQKTFGVHMNVLVDGQPTQVTLPQLLDHFLAFRREVLVKIAEKRIRAIETRLHKLDAYLKALSAIDKVVQTIKSSKDRAAAKPKLRKLLSIDEQQAEWIVEMPLGSLTALDQFKLKEEAKTLKAELKELQKFIKTPQLVTEKLVADLKELKKAHAAPRQTKLIGAEEGAEAIADFSAPAEDCMLLMSAKGQALCGTGNLKRGASLNLAGDDTIVCAEDARTDQEWVVFTDVGKAYRLRLAELPLASKRDKGQSLTELLPMEQTERVVGAHKFDKDRKGTALFVYASGTVKRTDWGEFASVHSSGIVAAKPNPGDRVLSVTDCPDSAEIVLVAPTGKGIRFAAKDMRPMGRSAAGVRGMKLADDVEVVGGEVIADNSQQLLLLTSTRYAKRIPLDDFPSQGRGGGGVTLMKAGGKYGEPARIAICDDKSDLWLQRDGKLADYPAKKVAKAGRAIVPKVFEPAASTTAVLVRPAE